MRHKLAGQKLSRTTGHRKALRRNLAAALFQHGRIKTTLPKARHVQRFVERIISIAKRGDLAARRRVIAVLQDRFLVDQEETDIVRSKSWRIVKGPKLVRKIFDEIAPKYADRPGGYTRIIHLGKPRLGDNGQQVYLELVDPEQQKQTRRTRTGGGRRRKAQVRYQAAAVLKSAKAGKKEHVAEETAEPEAAAPQGAEAQQGEQPAAQAQHADQPQATAEAPDQQPAEQQEEQKKEEQSDQ